MSGTTSIFLFLFAFMTWRGTYLVPTFYLETVVILYFCKYFYRGEKLRLDVENRDNCRLRYSCSHCLDPRSSLSCSIHVVFTAISFHFPCYMMISSCSNVQGGSNMTGTDLCVNKPHCAAAVRP